MEKKKFRLNFDKTTYGWFEIEAETLEEAKKKFDDGDYDEFENKSDYEYDRDESGDPLIAED